MFVRRNVPLAGNAAPAAAPQPTHTGIRPSLINSSPVVSSGSRTLDSLLAHGGIPLGSSLAILEHGTTDYASSIAKAFCSLGLSEMRSQQKTVLVVVGTPEFCKSLPSIEQVKGDFKGDQAQQQQQQQKRKIAWRYRPAHEPEAKPSKYAPNLNYKSATVPRASPTEVKYILGSSLAQLVSELDRFVSSVDANTVCRIVVPNLLHPSIYSPQSANPKEFVPFLYALRAIVKSRKAALILSTPLQLYPHNHPVTVHLTQLVDAAIELEPFENDKVQGFLNVLTLADLTCKGEMVTRKQEYAFRLSRSQFEVSEWAIPVEEGEPEAEQW